MSNYTFLGEIDPQEIKDFLKTLNEDEWIEDSIRQNTFDAHKYTETIPILWDFKFLSEVRVGRKRKYYEHYSNTTFSSSLKEKLKEFYGYGKVIRILITKLKANKDITAHVDNNQGLELCHRVHIPIITNENVLFYIDGEEKNMKQGEMWEIDNQKMHWVKNQSDEDRIHFIVDYYAV